MVMTLRFSGYRMRSLAQGDSRLQKHNVGNRWREEKHLVNVCRGNGGSGSLPMAQIIGLCIGRTDDLFLFFPSYAQKNAHLMIASVHKHSLSFRTR